MIMVGSAPIARARCYRGAAALEGGSNLPNRNHSKNLRSAGEKRLSSLAPGFVDDQSDSVTRGDCVYTKV